MTWTRRFDRPIVTMAGQKLATLSDARRFMLNLEGSRTWRNEWQNAADKLMKAAAGGSVAEARESVRNALFLNMMLDFENDKGK